ncbi:uncharacterized protein LOC105252625 isoform X2 [Camponotus floridanus]|uniref:uncharacterized protein LOC105252625 isoform X2 n=1 Tax=Camponotus floridanus TaxID=104421 RepID=UPI00059CC1C5|nr:uncharacterized protein LOC105252625 isoform X2 [Camponotus floridanus]
MTRKCALCKESNYKKNNYSFFSAPKDAETRRKWQNALAIKNYIVTDDTYVCSRHFHKNDIITHWISGVPPQVIKIKYKKCRLRPGAVPIRNFHLVNNLSTNKDSLSQHEIDIRNLTPREETSEESEIFLIPRRKKSLSDNEDAENENTNVHYHTYSKSQDYNSEENDDLYIQLSREMDKEDIDISINDSKLKKLKSEIKESVKTLKCDNNYNPDFIEIMTNEDKKKTQISSKLIRAKKFNKATECSIERYDSSEDETSMKTLQHNVDSVRSYSKKKPMKKLIRNDLYINNKELATLNYNCLDMQNKVFDAVSENEILFEDFLEVCTEVSIPHGWSCLVTSKGHGTTVVYLYMGITKDGLPFVEKQGFIRSDMVLHCAVANREIDPLMHNLVKERKMRNLLDIEIFIDEFDQRVICQGIHDRKNFQDFDMTKVAYEDGIRWRHVSCSLIVNNNSSRCTKCAKLSHILNKS